MVELDGRRWLRTGDLGQMTDDKTLRLTGRVDDPVKVHGHRVDLQEVDNAVNQAHKEVAQRYDFKGTDCTMQFDRAAASVALEADDAYRLQALSQILRENLRSGRSR